MSKKNPGYYTPQRGKTPELIHRAIEIVSHRNGGLGATVDEIVAESGVSREKIVKELSWGKNGNADHPIVDRIEVEGEVRYRHTHRYDPDQRQVAGR